MVAKVVVITGASSGIGKAAARHLAAKGEKVVLGARGLDRLAKVTAQIVATGGIAVCMKVDVTQRAELEALVASARDHFGRVDVLISNAGAMPTGPIEEFSVEDWEQMIDVNIKGTLYGIAAALPVFKEQGSGHFINIASTAARKTVPGQAVYSATKAAVVALSDGLRQELAARFRTTVISPGFTDTNIAEHIKDEAVRAQLRQAAPKFAMSPEVIAQAIAYAIDQPETVNIGEIIIRSTAQS